MSNHYYYKCGTHIHTGDVVCNKSLTNYKDFDIPTNYEKILTLSLSKSFADKKHSGAGGLGIFGAFARLANAETGETHVLTKELGTPDYIIINHTYSNN